MLSEPTGGCGERVREKIGAEPLVMEPLAFGRMYAPKSNFLFCVRWLFYM